MAFLRRSWLAGSAIVVLTALAGAAPSALGQADGTRENDIKAVYLYNFAKYVSWPAAIPDGDTFKICVLADAAFMKSLDAILSGEVVDGHRVIRAVPDSVSETRSCRILFVAKSESERAQRLVDAVRANPVLAVGDASDFLTRGGAIAFVRDGDRLRFDVNMEEARRSRLTISSRLLRVARRVLHPSAGGDDAGRPQTTATAGPNACCAEVFGGRN
jgi:hypothetical protein